MALAEIDRAIAAGVRFGCVLADAGYGLSAPFNDKAYLCRGPSGLSRDYGWGASVAWVATGCARRAKKIGDALL